MAYSTASTLINTCLDNLAKAGSVTTRSGGTLSTAAIGWMNNALVAMSRMHDFADLKRTYTTSTVASQKAYSKPSNCKQMHDLILVDGTSSRKLIQENARVFDKYRPYPESDAEGRPRWYVDWGNNIQLYPIPDAVYTLSMRTTLWPTTITATTDTLTYQTDKNDIIVSYMCAEGFKHFQMYEDAKWWQGDYMDKLSRAIAQDEYPIDWNPVGRGFASGEPYIGTGDPWNDPMIRRDI